MDITTTIPLQREQWHEYPPQSQLAIPYHPPANYRLDRFSNRLIKRSVDVILGGALVLLLLVWIIPLMAIAIKLESRGPVFFRQKRTGLGRRSYYILKFRSMVVNNQADRLEVQPGDRRITRVGRFIRKYHIDELPQLLNVVWGDMSLVGPRPHMLRHTVLYSRLVEHYHDRHRVKPGIAGLAQMRGHHGSISGWQELYDRCASDFEYIEKWSLFGDLSIFFRTIFRIIFEFFK